MTLGPPSRSLARACMLLCAIWVCVAILRIALTASGLRGQYFPTPDWSGTPVRIELDPSISTSQISRGWRYKLPDVFSIQWSGWLFVSRPGDYTFRIGSDDGSRLYVDQRIVADTGGHLGTATSDPVRLERGSHAVVLQYANTGGPYRFEWAWARAGEPLGEVPQWRLSPRRLPYGVLLAQGAVQWIWLPLTLSCALVIGGLARRLGYWPRPSATGDRHADVHGCPRTPLAPSLACLSLFVALAIVHTWPLASRPDRLSRHDNADAILNEWTMAWVVHEAPRHPLQVFDANIFHPERHTLAFSEALIVQSAMAAPVLWLGGSPLLAYNLVLIAGFALTGWTMCLVVATWTGRWTAGIASGAIVAFNAHTLTRLPHLQAQHAEFLPLALLALDAVLTRPRWADALWLALWMVAQALASIYLLVFTSVALVVAVLARPEDWLGDRFRPVVPKLAAAAALAALALVPLILPYWRLHQAGFVRSLDEVGFFAATARDYLASPSRVYFHRPDTTALFPGAIGMTLAAGTLVTGSLWRDSRQRMCLAFGVCGVVLSFGPAVASGYEQLYAIVPLFQAVRASARFGYLAIVAVAALAGHGLVALQRPIASRTAWAIVMPVALALVAFEPLAAPIGYTDVAAIPSIYRIPRAEAEAIVVDLPFPPPEALHRNAPYMLASTLHWRPLLNGYSGFTPPSYVDHFAALKDFPSDASIAALQSFGVTHAFVHVDQLAPDALNLLGLHPALRRLGVEGDIVLFRVDSAARTR